MIKVKGRIECQKCDRVHPVWLDLEEEREESRCGCCAGRGTGRFFVDVLVYNLPTGWTRHSRHDTDYYCPDHKEEA